MFAIDTDILLHAANRGSPRHERASALLRRWRSGREPWGASWAALYGFLRVITHRGAFLRPLTFAEAWSFVDALLASPSFRVLVESERHADVVRDLLEECAWASGSLMEQLHTAALMREHGVKEIRTADTDFLKFRFVRVVNPLED